MAKYPVTTEDTPNAPPHSVNMALSAGHQESVTQARKFLRENPSFRKAGFVIGHTIDQQLAITVVVTIDDAWVEFEILRDTITPGV